MPAASHQSTSRCAWPPCKSNRALQCQPVEVLERVGQVGEIVPGPEREPIIANRVELHELGTPCPVYFLAQSLVVALSLAEHLERDESVEHLSNRERQVIAVFLEHSLHGVHDGRRAGGHTPRREAARAGPKNGAHRQPRAARASALASMRRSAKRPHSPACAIAGSGRSGVCRGRAWASRTAREFGNLCLA